MLLFLSALYFSTGLFGIITSFIISTRFKSNRAINIYLVILLLFISLRFITFGYYAFHNLNNANYPLMPFFSSSFPCVYLYFKNLIENKKRFQWRELSHFIFPISLALLTTQSSYLTPLFRPFSHALFAIILIYYLAITYYLLKTKLWNKKATIVPIKKQNTVLKNWSLFFFVVCVLLLMRVAVFIVINLYFHQYSFTGDYLYLSVIIAWVFFIKILATPEILYGYSFFIEKIQEQRTIDLTLKNIWTLDKTLEISNAQDLELSKTLFNKTAFYIKLIEKSALKEHQLRKSTLNISGFANELKIPKSHLTYIFKYYSKLTFSEFKTVVRILDAIDLIETNYLYANTLDSLAVKVGFITYNTFFVSFKDITGVTPRIYGQEFTNKINNQR